MDSGSFYGVRLNQPIMSELLGKMMEPTESDSLMDQSGKRALRRARLCETNL